MYGRAAPRNVVRGESPPGRKTARPNAPSYLRYHSTYARVQIDGEWIYLGKYGSEESQAKYKRLTAQWTVESDS